MMSPCGYTTFRDAKKFSETSERLANRQSLLLETEQIMALSADERASDERTDFFGRQRAEPAEFALGLADQARDQIEPSNHARADHLGHDGIRPARGGQFLHHAHIA